MTGWIIELQDLDYRITGSQDYRKITELQVGLQDYKWIKGLQDYRRITELQFGLQDYSFDYKIPGLQQDYRMTEKLQKNYRNTGWITGLQFGLHD
jgi:hypothetical protein